MMDCLMLPITIAEHLHMTTWVPENIYSKLFTIQALTNPRKATMQVYYQIAIGH